MPFRKTSAEAIRRLLEHHLPKNRIRGVRVAAAQKDSRSVALLKSALFDSHISVREHASLALAKRIGIKATAEFILKRYPGSSLSKVPVEFFISPFQFQKVRSVRKRGNLPIGEDAKKARGLVPDYIYSTHTSHGTTKVKNLPVLGTHRGFPVRLMPGSSGTYKDGFLFVGNRLSRKVQEGIAEHEYGEI